MSNSGNMNVGTPLCLGKWLNYIKLRAEPSRHSPRFHPYTFGQGSRYKRLHRTRSSPSLVPTEDVPLKAHQIYELLQWYAQDWSDFSTIMDQCLRNLQIKLSKISQNIEPASRLDRKLVMEGVEYAVVAIKSVEYTITSMETYFIPSHIEQLTILRNQLKKAAAASGPSVVDSSTCIQIDHVLNVSGYARNWIDCLYCNVHINAMDMNLLLSDYADDWDDLDTNVTNYVNKIELKIFEITKACLDTDEQSKNLIMGGIENAISRIKAVKIKIATNLIVDHRKQLTIVRDSVKNASPSTPRLNESTCLV